MEIVQNYGNDEGRLPAIFESHQVITEDGYVLNMYRITREENKGN